MKAIFTLLVILRPHIFGITMIFQDITLPGQNFFRNILFWCLALSPIDFY